MIILFWMLVLGLVAFVVVAIVQHRQAHAADHQIADPDQHRHRRP